MVNLFPHQTLALDETKDFNRVGYFLDMGLGKTYVGSEKMYHLKNGINLLVCQKSKIDDWIEHFKEHYSMPVYNLTDKDDFERFFEMTELVHGIIGVIDYKTRSTAINLLKVFSHDVIHFNLLIFATF